MLAKFKQPYNYLVEEIDMLKLEKKTLQEGNRQLDESVKEKLWQLTEYQKENERYKRLEFDNQILTTQTSKLTDKLTTSEDKNAGLLSTVTKMERQIEQLLHSLSDSKRRNQRTLDELNKKNQGFISKLFKK